MVLNTYFPYIKQASISVQCNYTEYIQYTCAQSKHYRLRTDLKNNIHIDYNNSKNDCNVRTALGLQKSHTKNIYICHHQEL